MHQEIITAAEIAKLVEHLTVYGEYDSYHDWPLFYTVQDKLDSLTKMLDDRERTEIDWQKVILHFIREIAKESKYDPSLVTNVLVKYEHIPQVQVEFLKK